MFSGRNRHLMKANETKPGRFEVLDAVRFVAAFWVAIFHIGLNHPEAVPVIANDNPSLLHTAIMSLFSGQMAVVGFFVISGFCIHYPTIRRGRLDARSFLVRRLCRIGIPMMIAVVIGKFLSIRDWELNIWSASPLFWSLVCEIIYYAIYPALWRLIQRFGIRAVLLSSCILSLAFLFLRHPGANLFQFGGDLKTSIFGLPCWLAGAFLAERLHTRISRGLTMWTQDRLFPIKLHAARLIILGISAVTAWRWYFVQDAMLGGAFYLWLSAFPIAVWLSLELEGPQLGWFGRLLCWGGGLELFIVYRASCCAEYLESSPSRFHLWNRRIFLRRHPFHAVLCIRILPSGRESSHQGGSGTFKETGDRLQSRTGSVILSSPSLFKPISLRKLQVFYYCSRPS